VVDDERRVGVWGEGVGDEAMDRIWRTGFFLSGLLASNLERHTETAAPRSEFGPQSKACHEVHRAHGSSSLRNLLRPWMDM
jgi:hypothetical protein